MPVNKSFMFRWFRDLYGLEEKPGIENQNDEDIIKE